MSTKTNKINWGYNCLTSGIHHGRPEKIWNLSLLQTIDMFTPTQIQELVIDRIYNDAMQMVRYGLEPRPSQEWAEKVKELAMPLVLHIYQKKIGEIQTYYRSPQFERDLNEAIKRNKENKLNPHYNPLHPHDTVNLLCRIVGSGCSRNAAKAVG